MYGVVLHEASTGIVLRAPGVYAINVRAADVTHAFETLAEARAFARQVVEEHDKVECVIYVGEAQVEVVRCSARYYLSREVVAARRSRSRWGRWRAWLARWAHRAR